MICENCESTHPGEYGSGRFCSANCARSFSTKTKRIEINSKVSKTLSKKYEITCKVCGKIVTIASGSKRNKTCGRSCGAKLGNSYQEKRAKLSAARINQIEMGNVGYGIKCSLNGVRCDSALEYAFLKWYWEKHPDAKITRFNGFIEEDGTKYQPDFIIDERTIVEVKYDYIGKCLSDKWKTYVASQKKKKDLLEKSEYDFLWITNNTIGNKFYRSVLKEITKSVDSGFESRGTH